MTSTPADTIAAVATPAGKGGVSMIRVSGELTDVIATAVLGRLPAPRVATYTVFLGDDGHPIDDGIAIRYPAPASFTGEDVLELHGHGGPVVVDLLLQRVLSLGARPARPGEFSERAFLNGKLDLAQAEAVADLIDSQTQTAARCAMRTLRGDFSRRIVAIGEDLTALRVVVEAALDFPDEDIDVLADGSVAARLDVINVQLHEILDKSSRGVMLREGRRVVIAGRPNAGKSSLLNRLAGEDAAIVTEIPGTTRDVLTRDIDLEGLPLTIVDTAGLHGGTNPVEQEGIRRAHAQIDTADLVLLVVDDSAGTAPAGLIASPVPTLLARNKIDLSGRCAGQQGSAVNISAKTGAGLGALRAALIRALAFHPDPEGVYIARRRHITALEQAVSHVRAGIGQFVAGQASELIAEELRLAQRALGEITGEVTSDDLLGRIFASFCIGK